MTRIKKQFQFLLEMDKEKTIKRQTRCTDEHMENDAEHAWHIALSALILSEYANEKIDVLKTVSMLLIHDVVEIDAGDTYAYDIQGQQSAHEREMKAANRLFSLLPNDQAEKYLNLWKEFEEAKTPEARFAHSMDNVQPIMLNNADNGFMWVKNSVRLSQILRRQQGTKAGSDILYKHVVNEFLKKHVEQGHIIKDCEFEDD